MFDADPVKGAKSNKDLHGRKDDYVFAMTKSYVRSKNFNYMYSWAPLKDKTISQLLILLIFYKSALQNLYFSICNNILKRL